MDRDSSLHAGFQASMSYTISKHKLYVAVFLLSVVVKLNRTKRLESTPDNSNLRGK